LSLSERPKFLRSAAYIGQKLDQAGREVKEMATNFVENTCEAIKSGWRAINPTNWGWG